MHGLSSRSNDRLFCEQNGNCLTGAMTLEAQTLEAPTLEAFWRHWRLFRKKTLEAYPSRGVGENIPHFPRYARFMHCAHLMRCAHLTGCTHKMHCVTAQWFKTIPHLV